ncbi:DUF4214 domain-containing protein [Pigmentiphaga aceris]|uniref:DUF4214 domain-containing protein n=1 Tax=Pigmentiphaga aceris TaxID=1940612 RepID=A0A5C0AZ60_9BURK|nr:DUF4214 domain-containing protein [Pigmentiphaga aceris]QEI07719.1 DUF4214 domain-containing protein [Pigmentiphaga aceris]
MSTATTIQQYYNAFYGRPADPSGLSFWVNGVNNSGDLLGSATRVFGSATTPEFALRFPAGTSISTFLDTAYNNMFNRVPDADGKAFWSAAFTNWVDSGRSEGEARAMILQNFVDAANGQSGTNDKLTITNKLTVADMMTASVKAYGTESVYLTQLNKAQGLLAGVDHTQASVDAALAKIKVGGIYEAGEAVPNVPAFTIIETFPLNGVSLSSEKREILKFDAASDAPFGFREVFEGGGHAYVPSRVSVGNFSTSTDRIDFTAFKLNIPVGGAITVKNALEWTEPQLINFVGIQPGAYKTYHNFFEGRPIAIAVGSGAGGPNVTTNVFVDINENGNLDVGQDLWFQLTQFDLNRFNDSFLII